MQLHLHVDANNPLCFFGKNDVSDCVIQSAGLCCKTAFLSPHFCPFDALLLQSGLFMGQSFSLFQIFFLYLQAKYMRGRDACEHLYIK